MAARDILQNIANDMHAGRHRRAKVRSLLNYYGLKRRGGAVLSIIRADLTSFGMKTVPDFAVAGYDDKVRFVPLDAGDLPEPSDEGDESSPTDYTLESEFSSNTEKAWATSHCT